VNVQLKRGNGQIDAKFDKIKFELDIESHEGQRSKDGGKMWELSGSGGERPYVRKVRAEKQISNSRQTRFETNVSGGRPETSEMSTEKRGQTKQRSNTKSKTVKVIVSWQTSELMKTQIAHTEVQISSNVKAGCEQVISRVHDTQDRQLI
jgi:hypothetical protein